MKRVFVYGSLKSGHWNNPILGNSKLLGEAVTKAKYFLTDCGFPYLIPEHALRGAGRHPTAPVAGEVYEVADEEIMDSLDALEGVGYGHYDHHNLVVIDQEGNEQEVVAYVPCEPEMAARYPACKLVEGKYVWG